MIVLQFNAKTSLVDIFIPKLWSTALSFYGCVRTQQIIKGIKQEKNNF